MASDEQAANGEEELLETAEKEDVLLDHDDVGECSSTSQDDLTARTSEQAEDFATELTNIKTTRKRNLMNTSLSVSVL